MIFQISIIQTLDYSKEATLHCSIRGYYIAIWSALNMLRYVSKGVGQLLAYAAAVKSKQAISFVNSLLSPKRGYYCKIMTYIYHPTSLMVYRNHLGDTIICKVAKTLRLLDRCQHRWGKPQVYSLAKVKHCTCKASV